VGIGNRARGDDAVGSIIAERLRLRGVTNALDCGGTPENYLGRIGKLLPGGILLIDAADLGREPGAIELLGEGALQAQSISTHSAGLRPMMDFLSAVCKAGCRLLAVQPAQVSHGAGLSPAAEAACRTIVASDVWGVLSG
jgi:hydrogenase 3 maturation protease